MNNKIYIIGPITGHPDWRERFLHTEIRVSQVDFFEHYVTKDVAEKHEIVRFNPVSALKYGRDDKSWKWNMRMSIWHMMRCSTVYFMRGWHNSRGARIEFLVADILGKRMIFEEDAR